MPLKTTVIGAWPKPTYLDIPDWFSNKGNFDEKNERPTGLRGCFNPSTTASIVRDDALEESVKKAAKEVIDDQTNLGIDVITDGEIERVAYYMHIMSNIQGIDLINLEKKEMRCGAYITSVPAVRSKLQLRESGPCCWKEWKRAADIAGDRVVVKYTIPGPMTLMDGMVNVYYTDLDELRKDLVTCINQELLGLVSAGCTHIQIDEPVLMRYPEIALSYGLDNLDKCLEGIPETVTKTVHLCCGYPDRLDTDEYPKAPKTNYNLIASKLDSLRFDEASIENAEARNDLSLLELFKNTKIILGSVTIARTKIETKEEVKATISEALKHIEPERLILAPDCGLGLLPLNIIKEKLKIMKEVANEF